MNPQMTSYTKKDNTNRRVFWSTDVDNAKWEHFVWKYEGPSRLRLQNIRNGGGGGKTVALVRKGKL
jgi:hypothetical protein